MANDPFPLGSVSSGTHSVPDLITAFSRSLDPNSDLSFRVWEFRQNCLSDEEATQLLDDMFDGLSEMAPPYCYFGASPDDGADFGFWPEYDLIREAIDGGDLLQVTDIREIPNDYDGQALRVRDGYMTLFAVIDGAATEIWTAYAPEPA